MKNKYLINFKKKQTPITGRTEPSTHTFTKTL